MKTLLVQPTNYILVRMSYGEDILDALIQAVRAHDVRNGIILGGVGSVTSYHVHVVQTTNLPPGNLFWKEEGPFDVVSVSGLVIDGRVHAHISVSDRQRTIAGHMERGCRTLTFAVVTIAVLGDDADLADMDRFAIPGAQPGTAV